MIDAKNYGGRVEARNVGGRFRTDPRLFVGGRDRAKLVDAVRRQVEVIRELVAVGGFDVPVSGVLCFVGAEWGRPIRTQWVKDVPSLWPLALPDHGGGGRPNPDPVLRQPIAALIRARLGPA